jgi:TolB protein
LPYPLFNVASKEDTDSMIAMLLPIAFVVNSQPDEWKTQEEAHLKNIKQVTFNFVRAGEGYFSPDGKKIIFQAEEKDTGNPFYQIFVMELDTGKFHRENIKKPSTSNEKKT